RATRHQMQTLDVQRAIAALERALRCLKMPAVLGQRLDPALDIARTLEALDRAVVVVRARIRLARAQQLARGPEHLARALVFADQLEQPAGLLVLAQCLMDLRGGGVLSCELVVACRGLEPAALLGGVRG